MPRARRRKAPPGPTFVVPPKMTASERRQVSKLIKSQVEQMRESAPPATPFRFRYQLAPLGWLAGMAAGLAGGAALLLTGLCAGLAVVVTVAATRHRSPFVRWQCQSSAAWMALWAMVLAVAGFGPWAGLALAGWFIPYRWWLHHYRWRGPAPEKEQQRDHAAIWRELAGEKKWSAALGPARQIPNGTRYPIICQGTRTDISQVMSGRNAIAAAYDSTVTEAYAEPREDGVQSRGYLTLLRTGTLDAARPWNGASIEAATGLAVIGRYPEGGDLHQRYFIPGIGGGARHTIFGGCDGSGKTGALDLNLAISASSGIIAPVILDPQMGQSLPAWREHVPYACGPDECMSYLRGLHQAMMSRSAFLAGVRWCKTHGVHLVKDCAGCRRPRTGMHFFDPWMTGLPVIEVTVDEAPVLLSLKGAGPLLLDIGKLGRKAGFRLVLAAQVPSIKEFGSAGSELRSMMVGGNVIGLRAGDKVTGGMLNLPAKLNELPKQFRDGTPTRGLGYADTPDGRNQVTVRLDWIEDAWEAAERAVIRAPDDAVLEAVTGSAALDARRLQQLQGAADDQASAQLRVLAALHGPVTMGELIGAVDGLRVSEVVTAVSQLAGAGRVSQTGDLIEPVLT